MLEITFDREREVGIEELREGKQVEGFRWKGEVQSERRKRGNESDQNKSRMEQVEGKEWREVKEEGC